jgi:hypothetical protein
LQKSSNPIQEKAAKLLNRFQFTARKPTPTPAAQRRLKIARCFSCGTDGQNGIESRRDDRNVRSKLSAAPPGLELFLNFKPAVETAGYFRPRRWRSNGIPIVSVF